MKTKIRTRYAPSPTGFLHIGGARTALFSFLYAKNQKGDFIIRIEDTDIERNVEGGIESQLNNLAWMHIEADESILKPGKFGPYKTTQKLQRYKEFAFQLLKDGKAYECFCSAEQLEKDRDLAELNHTTPRYVRRCLNLSEEQKKELRKTIKPAIRLKIFDNNNYAWNDLIRGPISFPGTALTDPIILRNNGIAMYNLGVTVDDHDMEISHVLRGEEHIANTPYQIAIKESLGWKNDNITYGHLSIIVDETGKKLSKRNKALKQFIEDYKKNGYPPEGVFNFLALLGWSPKDGKEIKSIDQLINEFDIKHVSKSPAFFDEKKLIWVCKEHIKLMDNASFLKFIKNTEFNIDIEKPQSWLDQALLLFKLQIYSAKEAKRLINELLDNTIALDNDAKALVNSETSKKVILSFKNHINNLTDWTIINIQNIINTIKKETNITGKDLFMPIRIACSHSIHGPELATLIYLIGKNEIQKRLNNGK